MNASASEIEPSKVSDMRRVGASGLTVSSIGLGTANFGYVTDAAASKNIMSHAIERGVNLIDTANIYNFKSDNDCTEALVGSWLEENRTYRDDLILCTKVYGSIGPGPNDRGLSARHIRLQCEASLRRLRTDRIDVYTLHHVDRNTPFEETLFELDRLREQGKIVYYATSNFAAWQLSALHLTAKALSIPGPIFEQSPFNLDRRDVEREVLPACRHFGIGFVAYSPLASGMLADLAPGRRRDEPSVRERRHMRRDELEAWRTACTALGLDPASAAIAWLAAQPGVTSVLTGPRTSEHLDRTLGAIQKPMPEELSTMAATIWPGAGEAPEAYAW